LGTVNTQSTQYNYLYVLLDISKSHFVDWKLLISQLIKFLR